MKLRIAVTADPYLPVPPRLYGGIERVIALLVAGLVQRGHDVTLIAHPQSQTPAALIGYGAPPHTGARRRLRELWQVGATLATLADRVDIIHSFGRLAALTPVLPLRRVKKVQSYQRAIPWRGVRDAARVAGDSILFTGCSTSLYEPVVSQAMVGRLKPAPTTIDRLKPAATANAPLIPFATLAGRTRWRTVYNCVNTSAYTATTTIATDAPLVFLGRIERIKGAHAAIAIARGAERRLIIAGNVTDSEYFRSEIAPHIDNRMVTYVGQVDDAQKKQLLGRSAALLMPIEWNEPFGIVMAEAFACGTPVIGFDRGSVPEVVREEVNGFLVRDIQEAIRATNRLHSIDRTAVRRDCEERFSCDAVVHAYEDIYREALGTCDDC